MNAIEKVNPNLPTSIKQVVTEIATNLTRSESGYKERAVKLLDLRRAISADNAANGRKTDYKKFVENTFSGEITGASAYKYAQCAEIFHGAYADVWDAFNLGAMQSMLALFKKDKAGYVNRDGVSVDGLFLYIGAGINGATAREHQAWVDKNSATLAAIDALTASGMTEQADALKATLTGEPERPHDIATDEGANSVTTIGFKTAIAMSNKELKAIIAAYMDDNCTEEKKEKKESEPKKEKEETAEKSAPAEPVEKSVAEYKADALNALVTYLERSGDTSKALTKARDYLQN